MVDVETEGGGDFKNPPRGLPIILSLTYPAFPSSCRIQAANENPLSPTRGTALAGMLTKDDSNRRASAVLPGLPSVVVTPGPKVPKVASETGGGDEEAWGQVLLHTVSIQFGAREAASSVVYPQ